MATQRRIDRARFVIEVAQAIVAEIGADRVGMRISHARTTASPA